MEKNTLNMSYYKLEEHYIHLILSEDKSYLQFAKDFANLIQEQYKNFINLNKTAYLKFVFNGLYSTLFWGNCLKKVYKNE